MTTSDDIKIKLKNITKKWFYLKEELDIVLQTIDNKQDKYLNYADRNKNVVTDGNGWITVEAKPTIPSASSSTPLADVSGGAIGSGTTWAKADHQHPLSSAYATSGHTHNNYLTSNDITGKADSSDFDTVTATVTYTDNSTETVTFYVVPTQNNS